MSVLMLMGLMAMFMSIFVVMVVMAMLVPIFVVMVVMAMLMLVSRSVAMQKFHIVVVVFMLRVQQHVKIAAVHSRLTYAAYLIAKPGGRNTVQSFAQSLLVRS